MVFGRSADGAGQVYALDVAGGAVQWSFDSGGSCVAGASMVDGTVYEGSGSGPSIGLAGATGDHELYAFDLSD